MSSMVGCDERVGTASTAAIAPAALDTAMTDRVTLEIKGAKLNVAVQNALRRRRSHDRSPASGPEGAGEGSFRNNGAENQDPNGDGSSNDSRGQGAAAAGRQQQRRRQRQGFISAGVTGSHGQDAGSVKEVALLKATVESLRAGLREKEDAVTEAEREKEGLLEQVDSLQSTTEENIQLAQKVAKLERQIERLEAKLTQAEAGRALTMTLVDTLKAAQNDLRAAHGQVSQRYTELENMAEDSAEAVRRGNVLLHNQQLKVDAQSRQIKRQEEDLLTLRQERELHLTKADQNASELAQVLRRERAGQGSIADAQAEVEELKGELGHMREAFARHRCAMRKNQEVIDAHEKALKDTRSDLVSLSLEAEKQSARHHQASADAAAEMARATADRNNAVRESGALRIEKEDLKDRLEEARRKMDDVQSTGVAAVAAGGARSSGKLPEGHQQHDTSPELNKVSPSPSAAPGRQQQPLAYPHQVHPLVTTVSSSSSSRQLRCETSLRQQHPIDGHNHRQQRGDTDAVADTERCHNFTAPVRGASRETPTAVAVASAAIEEAKADELLLWSPSSTRPARGGVLPQTELEPPHEDGTASSSNRLSINRSMPSSPRATGYSHQDSPATPAASAADAGAGGGGDGGGNSTGDGGAHGNAGGASSVIGTPKDHDDLASTTNDGSSPKESMVARSELQAVTRGRGGGGGGGGGGGNVDGSGGAGSERGAFSSRRSRPRSPAAGHFHGDNRAPDDGRSVPPQATASSPFPGGVGSRKRPRKVGAAGDSAAADRGGAPGVGRASSPPLLPTATSRQRSHFAAESNMPDAALLDSGNSTPDDGDVLPDGVCPSCRDRPYGLMINCSECSRQHHSSCVPEGQRVGKGLAAVFRCSRCSNNNRG